MKNINSEKPSAASTDRTTPRRRGWGNLPPDRPHPNKIRHLRLMGQFLRPYMPVLIGAGFALVAAAAATLCIGQAFRLIVDHGFDAGNEGFLDRYFLIMFGVILMLAAASFGRHYLVSWLGERVVADIRNRAFSHTIGLSSEFFEVTRTGEVLSRLTTDTTLIQSAVGSSASMALRNILIFIGGTIMLVVTSPKLSGLVFLTIPFVLLPILIYGRRVRRLSRTTQDRVADASAYAGESLNALQTVQAFNHENHDRSFFSNVIELAFSSAVKLISARSWLTASVIILVFGAVDLVLWFGARDVIAGNTTAGELAAFVFYAVLVAASVGALSEVVGELQRAAGATERLMELITTKPEISVQNNPQRFLNPARGEVSLEDVTFKYPNRPQVVVLKNFSLQINSGETVALVGPSGAGKTTVFQLLMRFYDPQEGRILIDGVTLRQADPEDARRQISLVPQDAMVFSMTVEENIRYGRPEATHEEVRAAAEAAQAAEFIEEFPAKYNTNLGERGSTLSGGQRQRIAIARAILRNAPILLLDEATSSLDSESEKLVQTALGPLMEGRTTLVIAHRLSTVLKADRIVVMDKGEIVSIGKHEELYSQGGLYKRLAELQFDFGGKHHLTKLTNTPMEDNIFSIPNKNN